MMNHIVAISTRYSGFKCAISEWRHIDHRPRLVHDRLVDLIAGRRYISRYHHIMTG